MSMKIMQPYYESLSVDLGASTNLSFLDGSTNLSNDGSTSMNNVITSIRNSSSIDRTQHVITQAPTFEDNDVFQCGKCKQQFHILQDFLQHKATICAGNTNRIDQRQIIMHAPAPALQDHSTVPSLKNYSTPYQQPIGIASSTGQDNVLNETNVSNGSATSMHIPAIPSNDFVCIPASEPINRLQELQTCQVVVPNSFNQSQTDMMGSNEACSQTQQLLTTGQVEQNSQRLLLEENMLVHRNSDMLEESSEQIDLLAGNEEIDDLTQGNGLITSLLQQIPPYDPIQKVTQNNTSGHPETLVSCASVQLTSNYITNANAVTEQCDKPSDGRLETILAKLRDKSGETNTTFKNRTNPQGDRPNDATSDQTNTNIVWVNYRRKFACRYCNKLFSKNFDLQQHERSHTGEKPFQCIVCGRAFAQKSNVKKHMASHKVWLKSSSTFTQSFAKGDSNESSSVDDSSSFTCEYCGKGFSSYYKRKTHMKEHKDQQVYKCLKEGCASTFQDLDQFISHVNNHNTGMTYRCHECHKVFKSLQDLGVHQYQVHLNSKKKKGSQTKLYACSMCPSKFTHPRALREHMSSDSHSYVCRVCDATFTCERYLRKHYLLQHKEQNSNGSVCGVCGKRLRSIYYLRLHMLIHTKELPYRCTKCDAAFNRKDKVKRHMLTHDPVKRFKCPLKSVLGCSKEFSRADKLKEHIISHSAIKKTFQCSFCNKKYRKHSCKVRHEKTHTSGKTCEECERWFENEKTLKSHVCKRVVKKKTTRTSLGDEKDKNAEPSVAANVEVPNESCTNQTEANKTDSSVSAINDANVTSLLT